MAMRPRSNALQMHGSIARNTNLTGQEKLALQAIFVEQQNNLKQTFANTRFEIKTSKAADTAKGILSDARKLRKAAANVDVSVPSINLPQVDFPTLSLPSIDFNADLPEINLPNIDFPNVDLPDLPNVNLPDIGWPTVPGIDWPSIDLPDIDPKILQHILGLMRSLFGHMDLRLIIHVVGFEVVKEFIEGAIPVIGQVVGGAKAMRQWHKAAKAAWKAHKVVEHQTVLTGDAQQAAMALKSLLQRTAAEQSKLASIKTTQVGVGTAGLFLDLGTATGTATSLVGALASMSVKIHVAGREFREIRNGNKILADPDQLPLMGASVFQECPLLGCYLLAGSDTSTIYAIIFEDFGASGWMDHAEHDIRKHVHPLVDQANKYILNSPYELKGLRSNLALVTRPKNLSWKDKLKRKFGRG